MKYKITVGIIFLILVVVLLLIFTPKTKFSKNPSQEPQVSKTVTEINPMMISEMRKKIYPGSQIQIEETLASGSNFKQYISSYRSEGLKIYGLLTVPESNKPKEGFPAIIFNHGYIPPEEYRTTERYVAYVDGFARNGYVVFKPDYRGHGNSEGKPEGTYYSPAYTIDVLNALASIKNYTGVNPNKIGMWGHSMGGNIMMRTMVISHEIKAGVIWSGVVGSYEDLFFRWRRNTPFQPSDKEIQNHITSIRQQFVAKYGEPNENSDFWKSIDPYSFLKDVNTPIQLHQGLADDTVPVLFPEHLKQELEKNKKTVEYYTYEGADHNLSSPSFELAMQRSIAFFDRYLK